MPKTARTTNPYCHVGGDDRDAQEFHNHHVELDAQDKKLNYPKLAL